MSMGQMFLLQGRVGPAVGALQDSVNGLRSAGEKGATMATALTALADALALAGRGSESAKYLDEAKALAPELKSTSVDGAILNAEGDIKFYAGDLRAAEAPYQQAAQIAARSSNPDLALAAKLNLARVAVAEDRNRAAIADLRALSSKANEQGRRILAVQSTVLMAEAMLKDQNTSQARGELEGALTRAEKLGLRMQQAKIHYLLGTIAAASDNKTQASAHFKTAADLLEQIQKESGAEHVLERSDLKPIYAAVTRSAQKG
jgi:tetratricopeptide (TPR) repeat protein